MPTHALARLALSSALTLLLLAPVAAAAQSYDTPAPGTPHDYGQPGVVYAPDLPRHQADGPLRTFSPREIVDAGNQFFGAGARDLASLVEHAGRHWGRPNGYILGEEGSGAFIGGLRYGEGTLYTRPGDGRRVFWQGPSIGWDFGGNGNRTMFLIYNLPAREALYGRFGGINGAVYLVGGLGMTALENNGIVLVPIQFGVGARLGVNFGYLKFTPRPTWNPF
jgi:hypothetical protein